MQVPDRASFSGELRVERVIVSSLTKFNGRVSPYLRIVCSKVHAPEEHSRVITNASDPAIWVSKDLPDQGFFAFESVPYVPNQTPATALKKAIVLLASVFTFEVWDRRESGDVLIGKARVPLCSLRTCHGYHIATQPTDVDTPDGRAATKVGPFNIEADEGKGTPPSGTMRVRIALKCAALLDLGLFSSHQESLTLSLDQLHNATLYGEPRDTLGDIRAAYWFDTVAPAPVRVNTRRLNRVVEIVGNASESEPIRFAAAQVLVAFAMWHDEALAPMATLLEHNPAYAALHAALRKVPEELARRKQAGLPETARSASDIQLRLKELLGEKVAMLEAFMKQNTNWPPSPEARTSGTGSTRSATANANGVAKQEEEEDEEDEDEEVEDDDDEEEEEENDGYYDLGLERMAALMAALDLLKYEPVLRQKSITVDYARRYSDEQFRELGLPLGVRVKLMEELKRLPL